MVDRFRGGMVNKVHYHTIAGATRENPIEVTLTSVTDKDSSYVLITLGHWSFTTGKICIVEISEQFVFIDTYRDEAKTKACEKLGVDPWETTILDWKFLGEDVEFIK